MQIYSVGGAVRDELLGRTVHDRDWVVVGATPQAMLEQGFRPVGRDFPVFLHPDSHEEYALARTERKTGRGYKGFSFHAAPDVTLEEDLARRDLTINAMARAADGRLIDPYDGRADIERRLFRHVSPAFAEDPLRILRVARFAARLTDFNVAPETLALMRAMVAADEIEALVAERVWQELARGLMETRPARMFEILHECGALARLMPELAARLDAPDAAGSDPLRLLDHCAAEHVPLVVRWACLLHASGLTPENARATSEQRKAPTDCRDLSVQLTRHHACLIAPPADPEALLDILQHTDALRRPERFEHLLAASACSVLRRDTAEDFPAGAQWRTAARTAAAVDAGAIARNCNDPQSIPHNIRAARVAALTPVANQACA